MQRLIELILSGLVFQSLVATTNSRALAEEKSSADQSDVDFVYYYAVFSKLQECGLVTTLNKTGH